MRFILLLAYLFVVLSACKEEPGVVGVSKDSEINIIVRNERDQNMFNPITPGHYEMDSIKLFYLEGEIKKQVYNVGSKYPKGLFIYQEESTKEYLIRVFVNAGTRDREETTTYIQWSAQKIDTLKTLMIRDGQSYFCNQVLYNGELKYDSNYPYFTNLGISKIPRVIEITQ